MNPSRLYLPVIPPPQLKFIYKAIQSKNFQLSLIKSHIFEPVVVDPSLVEVVGHLAAHQNHGLLLGVKFDKSDI
jgi:hypothetical protein